MKIMIQYQTITQIKKEFFTSTSVQRKFSKQFFEPEFFYTVVKIQVSS